MTKKDRPAVGTQIRILDPEYFDLPAGSIFNVVEDGEFLGFFGEEEITVAPEEITVAQEDGCEWYAGLEDEGTAWERVEEEA